MASSKEYLEFVLDCLSELPDITYRPMMGEYIIYYRGKVVGGVYDDRFLLKPTKAALSRIEQPRFEKPYEGAKDMLMAEDVENKEFMAELIRAMYEELPEAKKKR